MTPPIRSANEGALYAFLSFYNQSTGDSTGATPTAPANGAVSNADTLFGLKVASPTTPDPEIVQATAESLIAEFELDPLTTRSFTAQLAGLDMDQIAIIEQATAATWGTMKVLPEDIDGLPTLDACLLINAKAKSQDVGGNRGKDGWTSVIVPLASIKWLGRDTWTARTVAMYNVRLTPQVVDHVAGLTMLDEFGVAQARRLITSSDYPVCMADARGDGSTVIWPVRNKPVDTAHCFAVVTPVGYNTGGIKATISAVSTTLPYSITLGTAYPAGAKIKMFYEAATVVDA